MKFLERAITGFNLKDTISNIGGMMVLFGSIATIQIQAGAIGPEHQRQAQGAIGIGTLLVAYVTGKKGDLKGGQVDEILPCPPPPLPTNTLGVSNFDGDK